MHSPFILQPKTLTKSAFFGEKKPDVPANLYQCNGSVSKSFSCADIDTESKNISISADIGR